jgi:NAD(P)H dehydrogenase (quinone)
MAIDHGALTPDASLLRVLEEQAAREPDLTARDLVDRTRRDLLLTGLGAGAVAASIAAPAAAQSRPANPKGKARVLLVYTTDTNSTRQMAASVADGVRSVPGVELTVRLLETGREVAPGDMVPFDGLIIGTPTRHRNMHHRVKIFIERVIENLWVSDAMVGMVGGVFSVGGGHGDTGAGAEQCQLGMLAAMAANGMVIIPLPKTTPGADHAGCHWGPVGRSGGPKLEPIWLTRAALDAGYHHGANVARATLALKPQRATLFARGNQTPTSEMVGPFSAEPNPFTAEKPPAPDANPLYRSQAPAGYPSGDGFKIQQR